MSQRPLVTRTGIIQAWTTDQVTNCQRTAEDDRDLLAVRGRWDAGILQMGRVTTSCTTVLRGGGK